MRKWSPGKIKILREALGLTQEEFAHRLNTTFGSVSRWENGRGNPSRMALMLLDQLNNTLNRQ